MNEESLRQIGKDMTHEFFGNDLKIGKYFLYKGKTPIYITDGQFMGTYGLSNFWYWKVVLSNGGLDKTTHHGYGGDSEVFKLITKEEAIQIANARKV